MENSTPQKYKKTSKAEFVSNYIIECILDGKYKPGEKVNDQELSERLGVSRISVREALSRLEERRILTKAHWKGYSICFLSWQEIESIIEIREVLEELALRKCLDKKDPQLLVELENGIAKSQSDLIINDRKAFFYSDFLFHEILYKGAGNEWIAHFSHQTKFFIDFLRILDKEDNFEEVAKISIKEHREILKKMKEGDSEAALMLMNKQIKNHKDRVKEIYESHKWEWEKKNSNF